MVNSGRTRAREMHPFGLCDGSGKSTPLRTIVDSRERRREWRRRRREEDREEKGTLGRCEVYRFKGEGTRRA